MFQRILFWIVFNVCIAFFPLLAGLLNQFFDNKPMVGVISKSADITFFALANSSMALANIIKHLTRSQIKTRVRDKALLTPGVLLLLGFLFSGYLFYKLSDNFVREAAGLDAAMRTVGGYSSGSSGGSYPAQLVATVDGITVVLNDIKKQRESLINWSVFLALFVGACGFWVEAVIGGVEDREEVLKEREKKAMQTRIDGEKNAMKAKIDRCKKIVMILRQRNATLRRPRP